MKITGPTQIPSAATSPAEPGHPQEGVPGSIHDLGRADEARSAQGAGEETRTVGGASDVRYSESASAPRQDRSVAVGDLAREVDAGRLSPQLALERVMDRVLDRHVDKGAPAATREHLRSALLDALESDPMLAEKLAQLG